MSAAGLWIVLFVLCCLWGAPLRMPSPAAMTGRFLGALPHFQVTHQGHFAENMPFIAALKKGTALNVSARNQAGVVVTFAVPTEGFTKAVDGTPIDPQVLAERQKKMQEELQKRSEELRKRLSGQSGNPAQAPAADQVGTEPNN